LLVWSGDRAISLRTLGTKESHTGRTSLVPSAGQAGHNPRRFPRVFARFPSTDRNHYCSYIFLIMSIERPCEGSCDSLEEVGVPAPVIHRGGNSGFAPGRPSRSWAFGRAHRFRSLSSTLLSTADRRACQGPGRIPPVRGTRSFPPPGSGVANFPGAIFDH
jgi:hypothetical protein